MKILVTGGAGFIGSNLVDRLVENHDVHIVDNMSSGFEENINQKAKFHKMDVNDDGIFKLLEKEKFDIISHQAAQMNVRFSVDYPQFDAKNNIIGLINLMEAARLSEVKKVIFASSGGTIYGEQIEHPCGEEHPLNPVSPYGITKLAGEKYLYYYKVQYGLEYVSLRYGNVYGPRQNPHGEAGVVAIFAQKMLAGEQPIINGDGLTTRDYIYVDDIVAANLLTLQEEVKGIYNVTTGIEKNTNDIFNSLKNIISNDIPEVHGPAKPGEQRRSVCSYERFEKLHGWRPKMDFDKGMKNTVDFYRQKLKK